MDKPVRHRLIAFAAIFFLQVAALAQNDATGFDADTYVDVSLEAAEAISQAEADAIEGRWSAAAAAYHRAAERHGHSLVQAEPGRFINVRDAVNARICDWPPEAIAAYRTVFETPARTALYRARGGARDHSVPLSPNAAADRSQLFAVADSFFCTVAGADAMEMAAELELERGEIPSAVRALNRLAAFHPDRARRGPAWRLKAAFARSLMGDHAALKALAGEPEAEPQPGPTIEWEGRTRPVAEVAKSMLERISSAESAAASAFRDPAAGLSGAYMAGPRRNGRFDVDVSMEARFWRCTYDEIFPDSPDSDPAAADPEFARSREQAAMRALKNGKRLAHEPVFGDGLLYCHDRSSVSAVHPEAPTRPAWRYVLDADLPATGWGAEDDPARQFSALYRDGRLYVPLERQIVAGMDETRDAATLVCLEAASGKLIWRNDLPEFAAPFEDVVLDGSPLAHRDRIYSLVRRRKAFGFEACFLACFHARTGEMLWHTHVGEAPTGSYGYYRPTQAHPAAWGNLIVTHTNLGTLAAVDGDSGRVAWLRTYRSRRSGDTDIGWPTQGGRGSRSWQFTPTIIWGDKAVALPLDADHLIVVDLIDGRLHARVPLRELMDPDTLLGLDGDLLYLCGASVVCYDLSAQKVRWHRPLPAGELFGRGALVRDGLLVPTSRALLRYPLDGGIPAEMPWAVEQAGNLLPLADQLVVASSRGLYGLVSRDAAFNRLTARVDARPDDVNVALALAELAFDTGELARGLSAVREAVRRAAGIDRPSPEAGRLFERLLEFESVVRAPRQSPDTARDRLEASVALLEIAAGLAKNPEDILRQRLLLARAWLSLLEPARAVEIYQSVLQDASLRTRMFVFRAEYTPEPAAAANEPAEEQVAVQLRAWIDGLIQRHGPDVYAAVETQARNRLAAALDADDLAALMDVAKFYPNSSAAADAWLALARGLRSQAAAAGTADASPTARPAVLRAYRRAFQAAADARPVIAAELAALLSAWNRTAEASEWLERGARRFPHARIPWAGGEASFAEALSSTEPAATPWPRIQAPLGQTFRRLYTERALVLDPLYPVVGQPHGDQLIVWSDGRLDAIAAASNRGAWPQAAACPDQPMLLCTIADRHLFATAHRLFAIDRASGREAWGVGRRPPDDPLADPEEQPVWTEYGILGDRLFAASDRGEIVCIDAHTGDPLWSARAAGAIDHLSADDRFAYYAQWKGRYPSVHILDATTGAPLRKVQPEEPRPFQAIIPALPHRLLLFMSRSILAVDPADGTTAWRLATAHHFSMSTFQLDEDGLTISDDGRTLAKYDLEDGMLLWQTPPVGDDLRDGLWTGLHRGLIHIASRSSLSALDSADGSPVWQAADPPGLAIQPPLFTESGLLCIQPAPQPDATTAPAAADADMPRPDADDRRQDYLIRLVDYATGRDIPLAAAGPLRVTDVETFRGLFARDGAIAVMDGPRLIIHASR